MSKSEKKLHCSILDYLEVNRPEVYQTIKNLCLGGAIKPRRDSGVTFVIPAAEVLKKIQGLALSEKEADVEEALKMMQAHILNEEYSKPAEFNKGVSSKLGILIEVESNAGTVILKNGTKLTVDGGFRMMPRREGMAVYTASGPMPMEGPAAPRPERKQRGDKATGRGEIKGADEFNRQAFIGQIHDSFQKDNNGNIYLAAVLSLMEHLESNKRESFNRALLTLDLSPYTSLYLLIQPGCRRACVVSNDCFDGWKFENTSSVGQDSIKKYISYMEKAAKLLAGSVKEIDSKVDDLRWGITSGGISKSHVLRKLDEAYSESNVASLYADQSLGQWFAADRFKQWQDEARFHINYMITYWEQDIMSHKHDFDSIKMTIAALMASDKPYFSETSGRAITSTADFMTGPIAFIESHSFMYYPAVEKETVGADEEDIYGSHQEAVMQCAYAGCGHMSTLEDCAGICK
jgi:hypothetical protein